MPKIKMLVPMSGEHDGRDISWAAGDVVEVSADMAKALCEIALEDGSFRAVPLAAPAHKRSRATVKPAETR